MHTGEVYNGAKELLMFSSPSYKNIQKTVQKFQKKMRFFVFQQL